MSLKAKIIAKENGDFIGTLNVTYDLQIDLNTLKKDLGNIIRKEVIKEDGTIDTIKLSEVLIEIFKIKNNISGDDNTTEFNVTIERVDNPRIVIVKPGESNPKYYGSITCNFQIVDDISTLNGTLSYIKDKEDQTILNKVNELNQTNLTTNDVTIENTS